MILCMVIWHIVDEPSAHVMRNICVDMHPQQKMDI